MKLYVCVLFAVCAVAMAMPKQGRDGRRDQSRSMGGDGRPSKPEDGGMEPGSKMGSWEGMDKNNGMMGRGGERENKMRGGQKGGKKAEGKEGFMLGGMFKGMKDKLKQMKGKFGRRPKPTGEPKPTGDFTRTRGPRPTGESQKHTNDPKPTGESKPTDAPRPSGQPQSTEKPIPSEIPQ